MDDFVVAETAIRQLQARYGDAVWRKDFDAIRDVYTEDAQWRFGGRIMQGRDEIIANLKQIFPLFKRILLTFRTPIVDVGDGVASSRTYMTEQVVFVDGRSSTSIGTYYDRFVREDRQWKFKWRLWHTHYYGPADLSGSFFENPDFGAPPLMPSLDAASYDRSGVAAAAAWKKS